MRKPLSPVSNKNIIFFTDILICCFTRVDFDGFSTIKSLRVLINVRVFGLS